MSQRRFAVTLCTLAIACLASAASAAVVQSIQTDFAPGGGSGEYTPSFPITAPFTTAGPSTTDVLEGMLPSASNGNFTLELSKGLAALTDGTVTTFYGDGTAESLHTAYATAGNGSGSGTTVTYSLGGAYDIDSILVYGGWNDGGRDAQHYDLQISTDGGANYSTISTVDINPGIQGTDTTPVSSRVMFTENVAANLASAVTNIRLNFLTVENGYTGYSEIDVFGTLLNVPGDADGNGIVNINDFIVISDNFLSTPATAGTMGDVNFDGVVDQKDFREWRVATGAGATGAAGTIPEPASMALAGLGVLFGAGLLRRRS